MMTIDDDELAAAFSGLSIEPPAGLLDRVVARWVQVPGPLGELYVASTDRGIAYLRTGLDEEDFTAGFRTRFGRPVLPGGQPPPGLLSALRAEPDGLEQLRFDLSSLTGFARDVLDATRTIPPGQTRPYSWVAGEIGRPKAVRAVGSALGHNPVPILIPCHRVTRSDGDLGGYVFGTPAKERLLRAENADVDGLRRRPARGSTRGGVGRSD